MHSGPLTVRRPLWSIDTRPARLVARCPRVTSLLTDEIDDPRGEIYQLSYLASAAATNRGISLPICRALNLPFWLS